eukprot:1687653-Rhodomonas_salina.1
MYYSDSKSRRTRKRVGREAASGTGPVTARVTRSLRPLRVSRLELPPAGRVSFKLNAQAQTSRARAESLTRHRHRHTASDPRP